MSKIKLPLRQLNLVLALLTCYFSSYAKDINYIGNFSADEISERLQSLDADVDLKLTAEVKKYLQQYIVSYRQSSETLIGRSMIYFPDIENKILEKNLPSEIKFLSVIESSLLPEARSRVGAVGLWQFMKTTAKMYGLKIDKHVDERHDVEKSTEAALTYLSDLNDSFGDWTLALAAYNCGPGNVRKAMRRSGGRDYWSIRSFLPRETRNYVPKFIAMTYLMNYYSDHELVPLYPDELFVQTRKVVLTDGISFAEISEITGLSLETIQYYNPSFIGGYVPRSQEGKIIELPSQEMYAFIEEIEAFDGLVPDELQDLKEETQVAAQIIEKREYIEIESLPSDQSLENLELIYQSERIRINHSSNGFEDDSMVKTRQTIPFLDMKDKRKEKRRQYAEKVKAAQGLN